MFTDLPSLKFLSLRLDAIHEVFFAAICWDLNFAAVQTKHAFQILSVLAIPSTPFPHFVQLKVIFVFLYSHILAQLLFSIYFLCF